MTSKKDLKRRFFVKKLCSLLVCIIMTYGHYVAAEENTQTLESIHAAIKRFINSSYDKSTKLEIKIGLNDARLRLAKCSSELSVFWSTEGRKIGNTAVGIRCDGSISWTLYAPVQIKIYKPVVVASNNIAKNERLSLQHMHIEERDISSLYRGYITETSSYMGYISKRPILAGQVLRPGLLTKPHLVKRGERVTLVAKSQGIEVRMHGTALDSGSEGETIKIRNASSKRIVDGLVLSPGIVQIHL